jgi:integrase
MAGKVRRNRDNFYIDLHWKGDRLRLFSDRDGNPLYSERQANRLLERIRSEIDAGEFNPKNYIKRELKALRLDTYAVAWLGRQKLRLEAGEISHGYYHFLKGAIYRHIIPHLGTQDIRGFNKGKLNDFKTVLPGSDKAKKNILGVVRAIFTDAEDREDILKIPKFPKIDLADPQTKWLDPEAQEKILAQFSDPVRKAFYTFLVNMGIRPNEARALRWEDIDWQRETVTIHAAMDLYYYRPSTKEKDVRTLPLSPGALQALRLLPRGITGYVFTFRGRPFARSSTGTWWKEAAVAAGYDISLYQATKHSLGCQKRLEGVPLDVIQEWFGHKTQASTRRYAKIQTESLKVMHRQQTVSSLDEAREKAKKSK